jgi:hypothetical protein
VRTGLAVEIPPGFYGRVAPRSGLAVRHGIDVLAGVIDSDYRGEILCALVNHGDEPFEVEPGARVAQLVVEAIATPEPAWAEELEETERGAGGLGRLNRPSAISQLQEQQLTQRSIVTATSRLASASLPLKSAARMRRV